MQRSRFALDVDKVPYHSPNLVMEVENGDVCCGGDDGGLKIIKNRLEPEVEKRLKKMVRRDHTSVLW